jgi:DNA-binding response OmpR family regulator
MKHAGEAVTREKLLQDVWEYDYTGDTNVVDVYVRYLRHKIDEVFHIHTIQTIRSVGYMFKYEE